MMKMMIVMMMMMMIMMMMMMMMMLMKVMMIIIIAISVRAVSLCFCHQLPPRGGLKLQINTHRHHYHHYYFPMLFVKIICFSSDTFQSAVYEHSSHINTILIATFLIPWGKYG